jgi:toxin ParE1/3/4
MPPVIFHPLAERELSEISAYYQAQDRPGLCEAFLAEVERVLVFVTDKPSAGTAAGGDDAREWRLRRFPYSVIYRVREDHIRILALAAHKRRPYYWRARR